jgi:hypothetical protein
MRVPQAGEGIMTGQPTEATSSTDINALLPLPAWRDLSDQQVRGAACVWCGIFLAPPTAVDLGVRRIKVLDGHLNTYPRACRTCMRAHVLQAETDHRAMCEQCVDDHTVCDTARALRHLVLEHGR